MGYWNRTKIWVLGCNNAKILEKSRAARAKTTAVTGKNRDFDPDNGKNEDPAKMTYSIPDFVSRNCSVSWPREKYGKNK